MHSNTRSRGFASMNPEKQREIARKGGKAAHEKGTAHEFTTDEARAAGRKGGERVSADRSHMSRIGRLGGKSSAGRRATKSSPDGGGDEQNIESPGSSASFASSGTETVSQGAGMSDESGRNESGS